MKTMQLGMEQIYNTAGDIDNYKMGGKVDRQIVRELLSQAGVALEVIEAKMPALFDAMSKIGREKMTQNGAITPCPGVLELLDRLRGEKNVALGLLTGNIDAIAPLKLAGAGIDPTLFPVGAFGSDAYSRLELPAIALKRAASYWDYPFSGDDTVIIGDTPADIACARAGNATAVAVATGWHTLSQLQEHKPDILFQNMANVGIVAQSLLA